MPDRNETIELLATLLHFIPKSEPEIYRDTERLCVALRKITPPADGQTQQDTLLPHEKALSELIDKIVPGLDTGDILADARSASAALDEQDADRVDALTISDELLHFLHGSGAIDGVWFGDPHPAYKGAFWWRILLPQSSAKLKSRVCSEFARAQS